jgi:uncharacterized glyoxalase superfamily protein PhnB
MSQVNPIPPGFGTLTPHIICRGAADAIAWYKKAFGAVEVTRSAMPGSTKLIHAVVRIGNSAMMLVDEAPDWNVVSPKALGNSPVTLHLYVPNVDEVVATAVAAGAKIMMPIMDMFWGDRFCKLEDPFGHHWTIATHTRDLTPAEMEAGMKEAFSKPMGK